MLTDENLVIHDENRWGLGGVQRIYRFSDGHGLSLINSKMAHAYPFAWKATVLKDVSEDGQEFSLTHETPLTTDIKVFDSDDEANAFIAKARELFHKT